MKLDRLRSKKVLILAAVITLGLIVAGVVHSRTRQDNVTTQVKTGIDSESGINYNPATKEEKQQAEESKQRVVDRAEQEAKKPDGQKSSVTVHISSAQQTTDQKEIEVYAYVSGVTENGGACTARFTKDNETIEKSSGGLQDATTTLCTPIRFARSDLPAAGMWSVVMTYQSNKAEGKSSAVTFEVK